MAFLATASVRSVCRLTNFNQQLIHRNIPKVFLTNGSSKMCFAEISTSCISSQFCNSNRAHLMCNARRRRIASADAAGEQYDEDRQQHRRWGRLGWAGLLGFSLKELLGEFLPEGKEIKEDSELVHMIKQGIAQFYFGEYDKSEQLLHLALRVAQELDDQKAVTYIFDVLANLAFQLGQHDKAEQLFKSVVERHTADGGDPFDNVTVAISLKLAQCFLATCRIDDAIMGYHYCIAAQTQKLKELSEAQKLSSITPSDDAGNTESSSEAAAAAKEAQDLWEDSLVLWAMSKEQFGRLLLQIGRPTEARPHLQEALQVCTRLRGHHHLQTAVLRNDIGTAYTKERRYDEAINEISQAISIVEKHIKEKKAYDREHEGEPEPDVKRGPVPNMVKEDPVSNLATYRINLGSVQLLSGQPLEARLSCEEGARLARQSKLSAVKAEAARCLIAVKKAIKQSKEQANSAAAAS